MKTADRYSKLHDISVMLHVQCSVFRMYLVLPDGSMNMADYLPMSKTYFYYY